MSNIRPLFEGLVGAMRGVFEPKRVVRRGTVTRVVREGANGTSGRPMTAFFQIGDSAAEEVNVGNAAQIREGDEWELTGTGDPADPQWRLGVRLRSSGPTIGADLDANRISLVIPTYADPADSLSRPIGAISEEQNNSLTGPNGAPLAQVRVLYRTTVPGSYTVYGGAEFIRQVSVHIRATDSDNYLPVGDYSVFPTRPLHVVLGASLAATGLSVSATIPGDITINDLISGYHTYWRIKDEVAIAKLADVGGGSYELQFTSDGRGVESTTAVAHASGIKAELLCGQVIVPGLEPGKAYKLYITAKTGYGVDGDKSNEVSFTSWARTSIPAPASCTVEQREGGALVKWPRPIDPVTSLPLTAARYRVYRNTTATTSGATLVASDVPALQVFVQGSQGSGNYYGIQAYDTMGNESDLVWGSDTTPPPHPSGRAWIVSSDDISITFEYSLSNDSNASRSDEGFKEFVAYRATGTAASPTDITEIGRFTTNSFSLTPPQDAAYLFQICAADFANNISTRVNDDFHWFQLVPTDYGPVSFINGNFQKPGPVRTVSDAASTASSNVISSSTAAFRYDDLGQLVKVSGVGYGGADYYGFIYEVTSATAIKVYPAVDGTGSGKAMVIGNLPDGWLAGVRKLPSASALPATAEFDNAYVWQYVKSVEYTTGGVRGSRAIKVTFRTPVDDIGIFTLYSSRVFHLNSNVTPITMSYWTKTPSTNVQAATAFFWVNIFSDDYAQTWVTYQNGQNVMTADNTWRQASDDISTAAAYSGANSYRIGMSFVINPTGAGADTQVTLDDFVLTSN